MSLVSVVYCQVEVSASDWSLVQRSYTERGVSECDREASIMRRHCPTRGCYAMGGWDLVLTFWRRNYFDFSTPVYKM